MRVLLIAVSLLWAAATAHAGEVRLLTVDGAISPASAEYVVRGLRQAAERDAQLVVLQLDTPGGLDGSMRRIIREILSSPVPVATFVAPNGARAASAGTYILYASHIAAMAPATNLGAATPVRVGGGGDGGGLAKGDKSEKGERGSGRDTSREKMVNDAAAYIRSLAQMRGRNADWAEKAVRESVSLSASEAQALKVVDVVAADVAALLKAVHGRTVTVLGSAVKLDTASATVVAVEPDWRARLLAIIADPNLALILMMIGIYGLIFEFSNPGYVLPGVVGGICLLLGLFALQLLPVNYAGLALILLGVGFIVAEAFVPSFGALGIGGAVALVAGMVMLIDPDVPGYGVPVPTLITTGLLTAGLVFATVSFAVRARKRPVVSGREDLADAHGVVVQEGWARVRGELWRIACTVPLAPGQPVRVVRLEGLTLHVEPITTVREGGVS